MNKINYTPKPTAVLFSFVCILASFYFGFQYNKHSSENNSVYKPLDLSSKSVESSEAPKYRNTYFFGGEIPNSWNLLFNGVNTPVDNIESLLNIKDVVISFSPDGISFGDGALEQVDLYFATDKLVKERLDIAKKQGLKITQETIGKMPTTVINYPTPSDGIPNKEFSGGKDYIVGPMMKSTYADAGTYLFIRDWSIGSKDFEEGFKHFLDTIDFTAKPY